MAQSTRPESAPATDQDQQSRSANEAERRARTVSTMVSAALLAVVGTLIFAWALRATEYPWLFALGALPWGVGLCLFGSALWRYTRR